MYKATQTIDLIMDVRHWAPVEYIITISKYNSYCQYCVFILCIYSIYTCTLYTLFATLFYYKYFYTCSAKFKLLV